MDLILSFSRCLANPNGNGSYVHNVIPGNYSIYLKSGGAFSKKRNVTVLPGKTYSISFRHVNPDSSHGYISTSKFRNPDSSHGYISTSKFCNPDSSHGHIPTYKFCLSKFIFTLIVLYHLQ